MRERRGESTIRVKATVSSRRKKIETNEFMGVEDESEGGMESWDQKKG